MKVLILTESIAGTGHHKAAENVAKGIWAVYPKAQIQIDTSLSHANPLLEQITSKLYLGTIRHASKLWGWAYQRDQEWSFLGKNVLRKYMAKKLFSYINDQSPDIIVSTHAFCLGGLAELKQKVSTPYRLGVALTDYCVNPFWIHPEVDYYFVGAKELKTIMVEKYGVLERKVSVTGIPIDPRYNQPLDISQVRRKLQIDEKIPHFLIVGGGLGFLPFIDVLKGLAELKSKINLCVITGKNTKAKEEVQNWLSSCSYPHPVQILDYVTNMEEWMSASDLVIGKPGGLTVSEALACQVPILIYKPIPGQEERNSQFLMNCQIALRVNRHSELPSIVEQFLMDPEKSNRIKQRVAQYSKPDAAFQVGKILCHKME